MKPAKLVSEGSLGTKMILAVALSYLIDGMLLTGFAISGTISATVPVAYTALGLFDSFLFFLLRAWAIKYRRDNSDVTLAQVVGSSSAQLLFPTLLPHLPFHSS